MTRQEMIAAVEEEIRRLEQIRGLLSQSTSERFAAPTGAGAAAKTATKGKRTLSPEARRSIALAQNRRWAKQKLEAKK